MSEQIDGYRGYIGSRPYPSGDFPQYVQNLLIRSYCQKHHLTYLLSATEYMMPGCYMMLEEVLASLNSVKGIILFSIFMLPQSLEKRQSIYTRVLAAGCTLHAALEDLSIKSVNDVQIIEDILNLNTIALTNDALVGLRNFCMT